ncbi:MULTISPECIES: MaoC family dehydratase [Mycobacteriaceae]|uniref:Acyl dehydratase n=2 Tax=Mycolicibacterium fortuitum TaxID=1766 RepID=A0A378UZT3_MYCFO|nr:MULTISPECIES: MaoC family dehydratase [Mycobacteriaceae]AIY44542.1 Acyl dehydratase [Mycobacterium sp. VKM Ac-1817D]CRL80730.1 acyl dehydratase [Mycolicibacter nonchromogenicus]EJZ11859.1 enoyl-CoA hydratase [Mycolicibacterium fortuitum subsp. fortuitum DSM 46621 = ATCC 6841 = JCM 6387]MCA4756766.1 MaoC family dehydratase [Mycolicibacterium fortuitum]MDG5770546.1 MaoC family dehydratase [Mycolicibacterium fortuitum]
MPTDTHVVVCDDLDALRGLNCSELPSSDWWLIDQDVIDLFAHATGDHQWIHVDTERAAASAFGTTIAHGYLSLSLVGPLLASVLTVQNCSQVLNYGLEKVRFPAPLASGTRVRLQSRIAAVTEVPGGVSVTVHATLQAEGQNKPVCVAEAVYRYLS